MKVEELAVIKERAENATKGPWEWRTDFLDCEELYSWNDDDVLTAGCGQNVGFVKVTEANAEFIANARQDVPKLVAEVERLQTILSECESLLSEAHDLLDDVHCYETDTYVAITKYFYGDDDE